MNDKTKKKGLVWFTESYTNKPAAIKRRPRAKRVEIDVYQTFSGQWRAYVKGQTGIEAWAMTREKAIEGLKRLQSFKNLEVTFQ